MLQLLSTFEEQLEQTPKSVEQWIVQCGSDLKGFSPSLAKKLFLLVQSKCSKTFIMPLT